METTCHALWRCKRLKTIRKDWELLVPAYGGDNSNFFDFVFDYFSRMTGKQKELFYVLLWRIWFNRNSYAHGATPVEVSRMIGWSKMFLHDYQSINRKREKEKEKAKSTDCSNLRWYPLEKDLYKSNCGAVIDNKNRRVGVALSS
ncbi:hypothetical protein Ddye_020369 [Dipteronia dyeriana]|uniref:Uncharacterized protein n=1 Tax=Dipteronia dyeriana TaxID=168575 RepID=A0AAD9TZJ6_9ROSI|nr:hypothetical protein Ddye_020369 [Dipteronia dyeriana]